MGFEKTSRLNSKLLHYVFLIAMSFPQKHCAVKSKPKELLSPRSTRVSGSEFLYV